MAAESDGVQFLCLFAQEHVDFRIPELVSIASLFRIPLQCIDDHEEGSPFLRIKVPSEGHAKQLLSRTLSVRSMYEFWGCGTTFSDFSAALKQYPLQKMKPYCLPGSSFRINVETYNRKIQQSRREFFYEALSFLPFEGKVNLDKPDHEFSLLLDFGKDNNAAKDEPCRYFFGRLMYVALKLVYLQIGKGQRHLAQKFSLKTRHFIGNTSMDPLLSFLMANQGQARPGALVFDPFVGTGSILLSCAQFGSHVIGSDIDKNLLQGRGKSSRANSKSKWRARDEVIRTNFRETGMEDLFVDVIIADASRFVLRGTPLFDAIITDPPYGVREGVRRLEADHQNEEGMEQAYPAIRLGRLSDVILSLVHFASCYLTLHGRLVFWLPIYKPSYSDIHIPKHPCMALVANSEQGLFKNISRRLITMEKVKEHQDGITMDSLVHLNSGFQYMCDTFRENYFSTPS